MNEQKQIEKMALTLSEGGCGNECDCIQGDKFNCHFLHSASVLYDAGYRKQEWISVEDRLPQESEVVLAYSVKFGIIQRIYTSYKGEVRWWSDECWSSTKQLGITHWMPLPEPPKMKGGAE